MNWLLVLQKKKKKKKDACLCTPDSFQVHGNGVNCDANKLIKLGVHFHKGFRGLVPL